MDPIAQALAEIRNPNQGAHDPIAQALTEIRGGSQISTSPSQPPAPAVPKPARTIPEPPPQPAAPEDYYPPEFAGLADPNLAANVEREIREAAPVAPLPIAAPLQDIGRTVQNIMGPTFEYGVAPFLGGAISGTTRFADAAGYLADKIGADTLRDKLLEIGGAGSKFGADLTQGTAPEDIGAIGNLVRGTFGAMGSSLPSLAMGLAATPMQGTSWASGTAAALRGSSDAFGEAGDTMREVLANGGSIEEARSAANKVAAGNLVYNLVAESLVGPFSGVGENIPGLRGRLFRGAVQGAGESIQETLQDMWSAANKKRREDGQPITYLDALGNLIDEGKRLPSYLMESGAPAFLSSFLTGAGIPSVVAENTQQPDAAAYAAEVLEELRKEDDARQTLPREERGELMRWAREETGRMAEEAQFSEDGTPENPMSEADLVRYQDIQDAMKRKDYAALSVMRGEAGRAQSAAQPGSSREDAAMGLAPEAAKIAAPRKGRYTNMDEFVAAATSPEGKKIASSMWVELGDISDAAAERILNDTGIDVTGYAHALDGSGLHHILNRHGVDGKALKTYKNQLAVAESDLKCLPEVVETPDIVEAGRTQPNGNATLIFKKRVNGHYLVVEDVRGSLGKLIPITMWKERAKQKADEGFSHTSETPQTPSRSSSLAESAMPPFETTSLKSGPSVPEPAPASLASTTPTLEPEGGSDWRYENRNLGSTLPPSGEDVNARALEDGENLEGYEQQGVGPVGTAPDQAESAKAEGPAHSRTPAEIRRLGKEVEARMIAAGRDVEEAKAMGLLASEFAGRFAKRTGIQPAEALDFEMRQGKVQGARGGGYDQASVRQSEEYDYSDPKTWPAGPSRNEALMLKAWQNFEPDGEIETWPESPEKTEALALREEYGEIETWIENLPREEFDRMLWSDEPEFVRKNERGEEIENRLRVLARRLRKKKPKGAEGRLLQLIEAEEEAAAREAETYYQSAYHGSPRRGIKRMSLQHIGTGEGNQAYGYGMYFAENRDVAQDYRVALGGAGYTVGGKDINLLIEKAEQGRDYVMAEVLGEIAGSHKTIGELRQEYTEENGYDDADEYQKALDKVERKGLKGDGQLYRLEVPENDVLLDWDKPLSQQPEKVKAAIQEIAAELTPEDVKQLGSNTDMLLSNEITGQQLYAMLAWLPSVDSERAASMLLLKHGIPGLRYLDQGSRRAGKGTHNFVIWDEDAISIEETYYQQRGPLTFKLTGKPVSGEYMAALEKLEAGEPIAAEEYNAIPEIQDARSRTATGSTLGMLGREAIRKQVYDKLMSYGSAVTEVVDGREQTVYNGEVRNDRRADIIIGLPASGKSSVLVDPISSKYKSMIVDSDEAKKLIPEFDDGFGAGYVHEESKAVVSRVYEDATDEGRNVVIPIVGSNYTKLEKDYINLLRQKGYKVYVHMADINPNVAAGRNLRRFAETGRFVDLTATSFKYGNKPREVFERIKKEGVADGYSRIDTTVFPGRQVEGTEDISHDRGDLRERRGGVPQGAHEVQGRESSQAGAAGGGRSTAAGLGAERAGGTSRMGTAPRGVSGRGGDINARLTVQPDGVSLIEFFESANRSTSFHELAHHMFRMIYALSGRDGVDPQLAEDVDTILREAGVTREEFDADTDGAKTKAHEFFARGFETYLSEGKAPTARLRDAFRRIRNWMIKVYNDTAKALGIKLSGEMRGVYDRLFASDGAFGDIYGAEDARSGEKIPDGMIRTERKSGVVVDKKDRDTSNDTRMMDLFNSPSVVAKRHGKFRPFFGMAKEAVEKQERMRSNWNRAVDAIYGRKGRGGLLSKEQVSLFNETLLEGDALGKAFSADELRERGFDNSMARAYRLVRGLYDNAHRMLSAQRNKYGKEDVAYREGYVPHFFHAWRVLEGGKIVTSFRSMNEAIKAAEKMKKEGENRNIRVAPALDDFGGRGKLDAVTLGDMQYFKLMGNVEKAMDLSPEEARGLLEGAARMKGRSRVFKNAWERKGVAGFDANMEYALRHYLNLSARYIAMDTLKHDGINLFERTFGRFDNDHKGLARYTKDYINDVLGVPSDVEQTLNNWVRNSWLGKYLPNVIGDRPATVAANSIASLTAHCKLGFLNIASAAMNLSQLNGTQAIIGPIWTARALKEYLHPNQMTLRLYADAGVEENITAENPSGYSKVHQARGLLADTSMMAFRLVDGMARKVTLIGAYRKALSQGMNRAAAIEYAKQVNDDVNFDYSVADAPNLIRRTGPIGTLLFQFKKFPVKMMELALPGVGKLKGWEQVRFWAPMVALSGVFGLPGFDWLKDWLKSIFGKDLELETKKLIAESSLPEPVKRTILYGALSNLGVDVGRRAGMGDFFPSELKDLTGPAAATAARVVESLPKIFDDGNFMDTIEALSPGLANPIKAVMGEARDRRRGRVAFRYETPGERIARATGARPIREAIENDAVRIARYEQQKRSAAEADAIDDFIRAREDSDASALDRAQDRLRKLRITPDRIRAEMIRRRSPDGGESTAYERAMRGARTPRRIQDYRAMENYAAMWE